MKPQHGTNPKAVRRQRDRHQILERAAKIEARRERKRRATVAEIIASYEIRLTLRRQEPTAAGTVEATYAEAYEAAAGAPELPAPPTNAELEALIAAVVVQALPGVEAHAESTRTDR